MKKVKKLIAVAMATCLISGVGAYSLNNLESISVYANANEGKNFEVPTFVYGAGLSQDEVRQTAESLGIQSLDGMTVVPITGPELDKFIGNNGYATPDSEMISSVAVVKEAEGSGIEVVITTPENISQIQKYQYENAAITAGIKDVYVAVGSIRRVTGESALAGIYKAFEVNNIALDKDRMEVAQKELEVTNELIQQKVSEVGELETTSSTVEDKTTTQGRKVINGSNNTNSNNNNNNSNNVDSNNNNLNSNNINSGNNSNNVTNIQNNINQVMIDVKSELGTKAKEGTSVSEEEINKIVEDKLKKNNVDGFNETQLAQLGDFFKDYNEKVASKAAQDGTSQKQLDNLSKKVNNSSNTSNTSNASQGSKSNDTKAKKRAISAAPSAGANGAKTDAATKTEESTTKTVIKADGANKPVLGDAQSFKTKAIGSKKNTKNDKKEETKTTVDATKAEVTTKAKEETTVETTKANEEATTTVEDKKITETTTNAATKPLTNGKLDKNGNVSYEGFNEGTLEDLGFKKTELSTDVKGLLENFDSVEVAYYTLNNPMDVSSVDMEGLNSSASKDEFIKAVAQDAVNSIKESNNINYKANKDDSGVKQSIDITDGKVNSLSLMSSVEKIEANGKTSTYGTLSLPARTLLNSYINLGDPTAPTSSRGILDLMAKEVNNDEKKAVVVDLGSSLMAYSIDKGEAKVMFLDKASGKKMDLNSDVKYEEKILENGAFNGASVKEEAATTKEESKETTMENSSNAN